MINAKAFIKNLSKKGSDYSLDGVINILNRLNNPEKKLKIIHIAGTNGKGSTATYLENILISSGYKVGTFLSPAVFSYNEILKINSNPISDQDLEEVFNEIYTIYLELYKDITITSYMFEVCMCYQYFAKQNVDFAIIECGLGGKYDATNIEENNLFSILTQIDIDHSNILGNLESIAENKCGIIRNSAVITTYNNSKVMDIIKRNAKTKVAKLILTESAISSTDTLQYITYKNKTYTTKLLGNYQKINLPLAIEGANYLKTLGYNISDNAILEGVNNAVINGRFEIIDTNPLFIIDGCHNPNASTYLTDFLKKQDKEITLIIGIFKDKDYKNIIKNTAIYATKIYTFDWDNPRHLSGEELKKEIEQYNKNVEYTSLKDAVNKAKDNKNGIVVAFGSLSFLSDIKSEVTNDR